MGPKPIQDVAPPPQVTNSPAEPPLVESKDNSTGSTDSTGSLQASSPQAGPLASGPEIVGDIPVRAPVGQASDEQKPQPAKNDDSSFFVPAAPLPSAINKDKEKPNPKNTKPKPVLAIAVAVLAAICLAAGTYLKLSA